jgi:hypothetical protein
MEFAWFHKDWFQHVGWSISQRLLSSLVRVLLFTTILNAFLPFVCFLICYLTLWASYTLKGLIRNKIFSTINSVVLTLWFTNSFQRMQKSEVLLEKRTVTELLCDYYLKTNLKICQVELWMEYLMEKYVRNKMQFYIRVWFFNEKVCLVVTFEKSLYGWTFLFYSWPHLNT